MFFVSLPMRPERIQPINFYTLLMDHVNPIERRGACVFPTMENSQKDYLENFKNLAIKSGNFL